MSQSTRPDEELVGHLWYWAAKAAGVDTVQELNKPEQNHIGANVILEIKDRLAAARKAGATPTGDTAKTAATPPRKTSPPIMNEGDVLGTSPS